MSDPYEVQHHLENGIHLFSKGLVFEARQLWQRALQLEPANSAALDYIQSSERELNDYDRKREEQARKTKPIEVTGTDDWDDDELEMISAGTTEELEDQTEYRTEERAGGSGEGSKRAASATDGADGSIRRDAAPTGWISVSEREEGWDSDGDEDPWGPLVSDDTEVVEEIEAAADDDDDPLARMSPANAGSSEDGEDSDVVELPGDPLQALEEGPASGEQGPLNTGEDNPAALDSGEWEPLDWMSEDTPTPSVAKKGAVGRRGGGAPDERSVAPTDSFGGRGGLETDGKDSQEDETGEDVDSPEAALERARDHIAAGQLEQARMLLQWSLEMSPGHRMLDGELRKVEVRLVKEYSRKLGDPECVPEFQGDISDMDDLGLDEVGGYILHLIDGVLTLEDIYTLSAHLNQVTVMRILVSLLDQAVIILRRGTDRA